MRTPIEDREIQIGGYTYDDNGKRSGTMEIYTSDYSYMAKLDKFCEKHPEEWQVKPGSIKTCEGDIVSKIYICPVYCVSFRGSKRKVDFTDEQKEAMRERMKAARLLQRADK